MTSAPSSRRYLSVWLRRLATDRLTRGRFPAPAEAPPLVTAMAVKGAQRLAAVNDAAARLRLAPGMTLADAKAMYPTLTVADADPAADAALLAAIAEWCDRYTPLVGLDPPDGLVLDITGCAHLFGGEAVLCGDIVRRLAAQGFAARTAVADTVGCAWAVARFRPSPAGGGWTRASASGRVGDEAKCVVPSDATHDALLPLPLAALRITAETDAALAQVGLKRIADVIDRPRAPLAARFGVEFVRRIDQALGREDEPIMPRLPVPAYLAERRFPEPIALEAHVLATLESLAQELAHLLERRGEGARALQAALFRADGKVHRIDVGTAAPLRDPARMRALFVERLAAVGDECDPGFGFDVIRLSALATERCDPVATGFADADHDVELAHLIDRLGARFGLSRVRRLVTVDTHIPEFAVAAVPTAVNPCPGRSAARSAAERCAAEPGPSHPVTVPDQRRTTRATHSCCAASGTQETLHQDSLAPVRPIRLFERPEPIEAMAEIPDGPPVQFTWRQVRHRVAHAEGPERIAMNWWRDEEGRTLTRDYFRIESREGVRVWVFREGLYGRETPTPRWFLHGLFA